MQIPMVDLALQYQMLKEDIDRAVLETAVRNYIFREFSTADLIEFVFDDLYSHYLKNATEDEVEQFIEENIE